MSKRIGSTEMIRSLGRVGCWEDSGTGFDLMPLSQLPSTSQSERLLHHSLPFLYSFGRVVSCMDSTEEKKDNKGDKESFSVLLHVLNNSDADTANQQKECDATLPRVSAAVFPRLRHSDNL